MKKVLLTAFSLIFFASSAHAGMYISGGAGINFSDSKKEVINTGISNSYKNSPIYSAAVGYELPVLPFRAEIEGIYTKSSVKNVPGHMTTYGLLANAIARVPVLGLYGGVGAGYASIKNETKPVYQFLAGFEYGIFGLNLGLEYKHLQASSKIKDFNQESKFRTDAVMLKVRFGF